MGRKGFGADGRKVDYDKLNKRDTFLARNGLLYGQIYGLALSDETFQSLDLTPDANNDGVYDEYLMDAYINNASAPDNFTGRFYPTSYRWDGFDSPEAVVDTEMMLWEQSAEQPTGYAFFNGDAKTEHAAADPNSSNSRYYQNMTDEGGLLGFDLGNLRRQFKDNDLDGNGLPDYLNADVTRTVAAVDGALTLQTNGKGLAYPGALNVDGTATAAKHVESGKSKMVAPDGLFWARGSDGQVLIVDEDSGNDYGERKYAIPVTDSMTLRDDVTGYLLGLAGGSQSPRARAGVSAMGDAFTKATSAEFSGSWDVTSLVRKKRDGSFYSKKELAGRGTQRVELDTPLRQHTFIGVVQHPGESGGQVASGLADQGGQVLMFNMDQLFPASPQSI